MSQFYSDKSDNDISGSNSELNIVRYQGCSDLLSLHSINPERYPYLLQSTSLATNNSRFDILFAFPQQSLILNNKFQLTLNNKRLIDNDFLNTLDSLWQASNQAKKNNSHNNIPFIGGWFLYLTYELLGQIEEKVNTYPLPDGMNVAIAVRIPSAIISDRVNNITYLITEKEFCNNMPELINDYQKIDNKTFSKIGLNINTQITEENANLFINRVNSAKKYIYDGDIFQSNLSRQWIVNYTNYIRSVDIYFNLRNNNPAAFSGIAKFNKVTVISSSPERLIRVKNGIIETRPIAGTIQRSPDKTKDKDLSNQLFKNPKEISEHIMLVDMERNDLGRVCTAGTVQVNELMTLESLAHVHHIVSNIQGKLKTKVTPGKIIKAVFPGGSITGCPKVRCMQIIYELEEKARNSYTGSMGYLNNNGDMDLNILIRTIEKTDSSISFRTGAGIVNDSDSNNELLETRSKAKGLIAAIV